MDTDDEAYHSGLNLPSGNENFKESLADGSEMAGQDSLVGTPPKERSTMNIKDKLFGGNLSSTTTTTTDIPPGNVTAAGSSSIKPAASSVNPPSLVGMTSAVTPTTYLAGRLDSFSIVSKKGGGDGKLPSISDSPTSEYASGNFSSLAESDRGYVSLPSMTSLEKPEDNFAPGGGDPTMGVTLLGAEDNLSGESMEVDSAIPKVSVHKADVVFKEREEASKIDIVELSSLLPTSEKIMLEMSSSSGVTRSRTPSPSPVSRLASSVRSESPTIIPTVAENVEIVTDGGSLLEQRQEGGVLSKRSAEGLSEPDLGPSSKNPRLSPEITGKTK